MEAKRIRPERINAFILFTAIIFAIILFVLINIKPAFSQNSIETGLYDNSIAGKYSADLNAASFDIKIYQNFPNPFSGTTTIKFETASFSNLKLAIFDSYGNLVKAYLYDNMQPGIHEVRVDGSDFPAGEYTYRFISGNYSQSHKMTIIK